MVYSLAELIYLSTEELRVAEKLHVDSPQRKSILSRRLTEIRADNEQKENKKADVARK
jgi:hypothetical protein